MATFEAAFRAWEVRIACPTCGAPVGERCRTVTHRTELAGSRTPLAQVHVRRWRENPHPAPLPGDTL